MSSAIRQTQGSIDPQTESALLRMPLEMRLEIYSYILSHHPQIHLSFWKGCLRLSPCSEPDKNKHSSNSLEPSTLKSHDGSEREPEDNSHSYSSRLASTWGPHWMCEENMIDTKANYMEFSLFRVCKRLYIEATDFMTRTAAVNVTDLHTLQLLGEGGFCASSGSPSIPAILGRSITQLSITLRLPLAFFHALERPAECTAHSSEPEHTSMCSKSWSNVGYIISQLKTLTKLRLWFDHSEACTWSKVNEVALLSDLISQVNEARQPIDVSVFLPKLHPLHEHESRHYMTADLGPSIRLHRKLRQRWHYIEVWGDFEVSLEPDFPFMLEVMRDFDHYTLSSFRWDSLETIEEHERHGWKSGTNMEREALSFREPYCTLRSLIR